MPCRSCPDESNVRIITEYKNSPQLVAKLDEITALLCDTLNEIRVRTPITYERILKRSKNLRNWWEQHQKDDEKRTGKKFSRTKF